MKNKKVIPVTVISGFLGSGKTTLLSHLLANRQGLKIALIVNDMASVNIDAKIIKTKEKMVELSNGCICCTLRLDLVEQLDEMYRDGGFDYVVIEGTGIAEPLPIAQTFCYPYEDQETGKVVDITDKYKLDTLVTVVDSKHFMDLYTTENALHKMDKSADCEDERSVADLLSEQVEFANVIMLNKTDLASKSELETLEQFIRTINKKAIVYRTKKSEISFGKIINTGLFDMEQMSEMPAWADELVKVHIPETEEYGISSLVFRSRAGFHPARFLKFVEKYVPYKILRTKGVFWMPSRSDEILFLSQAGKSSNIEMQGAWWATDPQQLKEADSETKKYVQGLWMDKIGDRHIEMVFIGQQMDKKELQDEIEKCELTASELDDWENGLKFEDKWPKS